VSTGRRITIPRGYKLDKAGKLQKSTAHLDVSAKLRAQANKRIKIVRGRPK
jgi:hypothetical protein